VDAISDLVFAKKHVRLWKEIIAKLQFLDNLILSLRNEKKATGRIFLKGAILEILTHSSLYLRVLSRVGNSGSCQPDWPDYINGSDTNPTRLLIG
jgi:hypothetical protein